MRMEEYMKKFAIVFGSSRSNGHTMAATKQVMQQIDQALLIDLADHPISNFNYEHDNENDDFLNIIKSIIEYKTIILATPIYWYTTSASMKRFIDRITDLLTIHKDLGRALRNKNIAIICSYATHPEGTDGFERTLVNTANYLGMRYLGCYFYYSGDISEILELNKQRLTQFIERLQLN